MKHQYDVITKVLRPGGKVEDVPIGRAFTTKDGVLDVYLDALPSNAKLRLIPKGDDQ